jgi:hypothetical protein
MQYKIVGDRSMIKLTNQVNDLIAEDWEPQGGICLGFFGEGKNELYLQAMIRTKVPPSKQKPKGNT